MLCVPISYLFTSIVHRKIYWLTCNEVILKGFDFSFWGMKLNKCLWLCLESKHLKNMVFWFLLQVQLLDGKSQHFCQTCVETVNYFIEFRNKCAASELTLQQTCSSQVCLLCLCIIILIYIIIIICGYFMFLQLCGLLSVSIKCEGNYRIKQLTKICFSKIICYLFF